MKICVSKSEATLGPDKQRQLKVWIEDRDGAMAVKGTAVIGKLAEAKEKTLPSLKHFETTGGFDAHIGRKVQGTR